MRMMKNNNNETVMVIGIDHGYGNMKTATRCFPSGVARYDKEPIFQNNLLVYNGMYYQIGEEHKEFCAEKTQDEDYYVLTLAAIAKELDGKEMNQAKVHIAAGLPLTWVATQKEDFQKYLLQNESVDFIFRNKEYHVEFAGADIYPQGFAAAFYRLQDFKGINMLADIGNGTMNIMYINNSRPLEKKCFTEKYGTYQCVLAVRESLLKELEIREKEDVFLERVETAVRDGVKESAPMAIAKNLMEMLVPFVKESVGEINLPDRTLTIEKTDGEIAEDNLDWEKEADMDAALDFADSF